MKRDPLAGFLVVALVLVTVAGAIVCYQYLKESSRLRFLQAQANLVNQNRALMQTMAVELNDFARRNAALQPVLDRLNLRFRSATNPPPIAP